MGTNLQGWLHTELTELWQDSLHKCPPCHCPQSISWESCEKTRWRTCGSYWYTSSRTPQNFGSKSSSPFANHYLPSYHAVLPAEKQSCITAKVWTQTLWSTLPTEPSWTCMEHVRSTDLVYHLLCCDKYYVYRVSCKIVFTYHVTCNIYHVPWIIIVILIITLSIFLSSSSSSSQVSCVM